jgi:hypothetical protein
LAPGVSFSPILSSGDYQEFCPLLSTRVHSCPLLSHSYCPQRSCRKNPWYNRVMKGSPHAGLNLNPALTFNRSVPTRRDRIARFQHARLSAALDRYWCQFVSIRGCDPKLTKTDRKCQGPPLYKSVQLLIPGGANSASPLPLRISAPSPLCVKSSFAKSVQNPYKIRPFSRM